MNGILIFLILFLKNIQKIKNPYSFPRRDENGQRQPSHATFPLKDSDKCLRMCCVWLEREFYPSQRNRLCHQGRSSILRVYCCREKCFSGLPISGQRTRSQTIFNALLSLYPTSVPWPVSDPDSPGIRIQTFLRVRMWISERGSAEPGFNPNADPDNTPPVHPYL